MPLLAAAAAPRTSGMCIWRTAAETHGGGGPSWVLLVTNYVCGAAVAG
jgi:hypothetical protein